MITVEIETKYRETLDYLYGFVDYSLKRNFRYNPGEFELGRMFSLMEKLGNPQNQYPILHIAGTKGKGSVSAFCESALRASGYHTGLYTSPHMVDFNERIQVDRQPIPHLEFIELVDEVRPVIESVPRITFFEITTALAYLYFARRGVDVGVIEVGLGGRLDATNICQPVVSVITSLSYDHMAVLGDTLSQIAAEKGGIIKENTPVVIAPQRAEAREVLEKIAYERKAPLTRVGQDIDYTRISFSLGNQSFRVFSENGIGPIDLDISLDGAHQVENAAVAYTALKIAEIHCLDRLTNHSIAAGFKDIVWSGRFETLQTTPPVVVDCAHNRDSAAKLRQALDEYYPGKPVILVFGASEDKDIQGILTELVSRVAHMVAVKSFHPRSIETEILVQHGNQLGVPVTVIPDVADAIFSALDMTGPDGMVLVTGSIFVAAGARIAWLDRSHQ